MTFSDSQITLHGWRIWIRPIVILVYSLILLVALPLLSVDLYQNVSSLSNGDKGNTAIN